MAKVKKSKPIDSFKESYCVGCGRLYSIANFYDSLNPKHYNKVLPYCKECCSKMTKDFLKKSGNLQGALWLTCSEMGVPFVRKYLENCENRIASYKSSKSKTNDYNYFGIYWGFYLKQTSMHSKYKTFQDNDIEPSEVLVKREEEKVLKEQVRELEDIWGDKSPEQLKFLEYRYLTYTQGKTLTEYQEKWYRTLCLFELQEREGENVEEVIKKQISVAKLLGLDKSQIETEKTLVEKMLESDIAVMEQEEPAMYYEDLTKYADHMGIGKYWKKYILRPVLNLVTGSKDYNVTDDSKYGGDLDE